MIKRFILSLLLIFIYLQLNAGYYYVSPNGNDANSGSFSSPWKTLSHACTVANTPGSIIFVNEGNYYVVQSLYLSVGVSIEGEGLTSRIISNIPDAPVFILESPNGTDGSQHISGIQIDGNNQPLGNAILIKGRSNVKISKSFFTNFKLGAPYYSLGTHYNEYVIEIINSSGGVEIDHNEIDGGIRAFYCHKNEYEYALQIHHNRIGKASMSTEPEVGIYVCDIDGLEVKNNYFRNLATQIILSSYSSTKLMNIFIYNNVMFNIGVTSGDWYGSGIDFGGITTEIARNIMVSNNTIIANPGERQTRIGIYLPTVGYATEIYIQNNIISGFRYATIFGVGPDRVIDLIYIDNNIFWDNTVDSTMTYCTSDSVYYTNIAQPLNQSFQNNLFTNPLLVSDIDFRLSEFSPAVGAGINIPSITHDYNDNLRGQIFDIGAYMYGSTTDIIEETASKVIAYPVPFQKYFTILVDDNNFLNGRIEIYNMQGKIIYQEEITDKITEIHMPDAFSGLYIVRLINQNGFSSTVKIIKY